VPSAFFCGVLPVPTLRTRGCRPMCQGAPHSEACSPRRTLSRRRTPAGAEFSSPNHWSYALPAPLRKPVALRAWKPVCADRLPHRARIHCGTPAHKHARTHAQCDSVRVHISRVQRVHTHTRTHTHARTPTCTHARTHAHMHTHTHAHTHAHTHMHMHTHTHTHAPTHRPFKLPRSPFLDGAAQVPTPTLRPTRDSDGGRVSAEGYG
jgi:hypothetical protein